MVYETAGDPISGSKWTRKTTESIAMELLRLDIAVSPNTVALLLRQLGFSLRVNHKKIALTGNATTEARELRDQQFKRIARMRASFTRRREPIISVDTKKKELIGNFKNPGAAWRSSPAMVNDHDFPSMADGKAIPYGVYDVTANKAMVFVGTSHDTPSFAADCVGAWWEAEGARRYPHANRLLILADNGGRNAPHCQEWHQGLSTNLCKKHGVSVTVCHYPPGASKWNPIEHRLFSEISKNWAGVPLHSYETVLRYIRTTRTKTGLRVKARLVTKHYQTRTDSRRRGKAASTTKPYRKLPKWNYIVKAN
ncbi:MAG: ISAzo13 family transposase [Chitinivibrionales bacterium]|nr:ISAzo13 family transposase [Chitinivibrionales bacterium]